MHTGLPNCLMHWAGTGTGQGGCIKAAETTVCTDGVVGASGAGQGQVGQKTLVGAGQGMGAGQGQAGRRACGAEGGADGEALETGSGVAEGRFKRDRGQGQVWLGVRVLCQKRTDLTRSFALHCAAGNQFGGE